MSLLWMDGFDAYGTNNGDIRTIMQSSGYANAYGKFTTATRTGRGFAINFPWFSTADGPMNVTRAFATRNAIVFGFAFLYSNISALTSVAEVRYDNLAGDVSTQIQLSVSQTGVIMAKQAGTGAIVCQSDPNTIFPGVWNYIEVKVSAGRPGNVTIRMNGLVVASGSGPTVRDGWPLNYNIVRFPQYRLEDADWHSKSVDDFYLCDTLGSLFNDFQGDVVIHSMLPLADAGPNTMSAFGAGLSKYTAVDDVPPDEDVSYLFSNTAGQIEMFDLDDLPANIIDVLAVSVHSRARKDAPGTSKIKLKARFLGDTVNSPDMALTTVYQARHHIFETAPDGGGWNKVKANALNIGVEIV